MSLFAIRFCIVLSFSSLLFWEGYAFGTGKSEYTISALVRTVRFDPVSAPLLIVFWFWLSGHFFISPHWKGTAPGWRDLIYLGLGVLAAFIDHYLRRH